MEIKISLMQIVPHSLSLSSVFVMIYWTAGQYEIVKDMWDNHDYVSTPRSTQKIYFSHIRDP